MKNSTFTILILLMISDFVLVGQQSVENVPGYIVNNQGDTITGDLMANRLSKLSEEVLFKERGSTEYVRYKPEELSEFHLEPNTTFQKIKINSKTNKDSVVEVCFALLEVAGDVDLVTQYITDKKPRYFVRNDVYGIKELERIVQIEDGKKITHDQYKMTLSRYLFKKPEFHKRIVDCKFHKDNFSSLISDYNEEMNMSEFLRPDNNAELKSLANIGGTYYANKEDKGLIGFNLGLRRSLRSGRVMQKFEFSVGMNFGMYFKNSTIDLPLRKDGSVAEYHDKEVQYDYGTKKFDTKYNERRIEFPVYFEYNNIFNRFSPIVQLGFKPYFYADTYEILNYNKTKQKLTFWAEPIINFGFGLNLDRFIFKYVYGPRPMNVHLVRLEYYLN